MTTHQRRRLEALIAAAAPCLGCYQEDLIEAERKLHVYTSERVIKLRAGLERAAARAGQVLAPQPSEAELAQERAAFQAIANRAAAVIQKVTETVPPRSRRTTCPKCEPRKRAREQIEAMAVRVSSNLQELERVNDEARAQRLGDTPPPTSLPENG